MRCSLKPCRNTVTIYERCNEHQRVVMVITKPKGFVDVDEVDVLPMTPAQKAAKTRAANKAKLQKKLEEIEALEESEDE